MRIRGTEGRNKGKRRKRKHGKEEYAGIRGKKGGVEERKDDVGGNEGGVGERKGDRGKEVSRGKGMKNRGK